MATSPDDEAARNRFEQLWHEHYDAVLAFARRRVAGDLAAEATADAFLVAWRRLDAVPDEPLPWLIATTRKTIANRLRSGRRLQRLIDHLRNVPPLTAPDPAERGDTTGLAAAFSMLSASDRETIALTAWEELTPQQAAAALGCSVSTYHVRLHRARARLRAHLNAHDTPPPALTGETPS